MMLRTRNSSASQYPSREHDKFLGSEIFDLLTCPVPEVPFRTAGLAALF